MEKFLLMFLPLIFYFSYTQGVGLYGKCEKNQTCTALDSVCKNGTCLCRDGFKINVDSCVEAHVPRISCRKDVDCIPLAGNRTMCVDVTCTCRPFHHIHNGKCIKNKGLEEICVEDYECYWGKTEEEKMGCVNGRCNCKPGSIPANYRRCVSSDATTYGTSMILATITAFFMIFS